MNFRLSKHAKEELQRRNIPLDLPELVLNKPQQIIAEKFGKKVYQSQIDFDGELFLLRALVADDQDPAVVITVYRTGKIHKYWR